MLPCPKRTRRPVSMAESHKHTRSITFRRTVLKASILCYSPRVCTVGYMRYQDAKPDCYSHTRVGARVSPWYTPGYPQRVYYESRYKTRPWITTIYVLRCATCSLRFRHQQPLMATQSPREHIPHPPRSDPAKTVGRNPDHWRGRFPAPPAANSPSTNVRGNSDQGRG